MRVPLAAFVLCALSRVALATECITVSLDVRHANVVAVTRYAGDRTFSVDYILRTTGERPSRLVANADWRESQCAPPEPLPGQSYVVALLPTGMLQYRPYGDTAAERALIGRLHAVSAHSIVEMLQRYSRGQRTRDAVLEWLNSAVVEPRRKGSLTEELLEAAQGAMSGLWLAEACQKDVVASIRTKKLPIAIRAIEEKLPAADTEEEFIRERVGAISDPVQRALLEDDTSEEWLEIVVVIRRAFDPIHEELSVLPWCDHRKYGW